MDDTSLLGGRSTFEMNSGTAEASRNVRWLTRESRLRLTVAGSATYDNPFVSTIKGELRERI